MSQPVVYASGVFDMFHYGHMRYLKKCRVLRPDHAFVVGVHSDADCARAKRAPVMTMRERCAAVREFGIADAVVEDAPMVETPDFYEKHGIACTVHAHTEAEHGRYVRAYYQDAERLGMLVRLDYTSEISTTELIRRITANHDDGR